MKQTIRVRAFGGLDERNAFADDMTYAVSMLNYRITENRTLCKRDGLTNLYVAREEITGMWSGYLQGEAAFLFTSGGKLYRRYDDSGIVEEIGEVGEGKNVLFSFGQYVYIKNLHRYSRYDGRELKEVTGYVPLVAIGCGADGSGSTFEDVNLLSSKRRVRFSCDGSATVFRLPESDLISVQAYGVGTEELPTYDADLAAGTLTFSEPPEEGINNLEVCYDTGRDRASVILGCDGVMLFGGNTDGHVFLWGNPSYVGYRFHSELADGLPSAEYFPENNYTIIGDSEITDIIAQYDRQLIFTKDRAYYSYCELQKDTLGNAYASFPVYNLNGEKGSLLRNAGCIMNNEPVTLCVDGLNRWSSTVVANEKNAICFSGAVQKTLAEWMCNSAFDRFLLFNRRATGELFFFHEDKALVYNYRIGAWYLYGNFGATGAVEHAGRFFISRGRQILVSDDSSSVDCGEPFSAYWETPYIHATKNGREGRIHRILYAAKVSGTFKWEFTYFGRQHEALAQRSLVELSAPIRTMLCGSFRPPRSDQGMFKLRLTEQDYAFCELCELQLQAGQKGYYGRKGL